MTAIRRLMMSCATSLSFALATPMLAQGPEVRGVLRDSASGEPIAGAVVLLVDAQGQIVNRTIAGARGQYRVLRPASAVLLRAMRLGFRPHTLALPAVRPEGNVIDVALATVARALEAMDIVAAQGCPTRADRAEAFGLLDQVRAGLLATIVARERLPATMHVLRYERWLDLDGVAIERQTVQLDSSAGATTSFNAVQSAVDFVARGFRSGRDGNYTYFGPDAEVLLDERFQRGYCFSLAAPTAERPSQVGLRFTPAASRRGRVDIDGTLWIDTAQRTLQDVEFLYVGIERLAASFASGGHIHFHALPSGVTFIDRWSLRLVGAADTIVHDGGVSTQAYAVREIGGEVAFARWPDSSTYVSSLATAHLSVVRTDGAPATNTRVRLAGTDYRAFTDSLGRASMRFVLPGPYRLSMGDPRLDVIDWEIPISRPIQIQRRASSILRIVAPTAEQHVASLCGRDTLLAADAWLLTRVIGASGESVGDIEYRVSERSDGDWRTVSSRGRTPSTGLVATCRGLSRGSDVEFAALRRGEEAARVRSRLDEKLTVLRAQLPNRRIVGRAADSSLQVVTGVVLDTTSQAPIANARISFIGAPFETATDDSGRFVMPGVSPGVHRVEVSTPWYDSIGVVHRATVTVRADTLVTVRFPGLDDVMRATCGGDARSGAVVGRIRMRDGGELPSDLRLVAEWTPSTVALDSAPATVQAAMGSGGTFRLCGVPFGTSVTVRGVAMDQETAMNMTRTVQIAPARRFARVDLELVPATPTMPFLIGQVVSDSSGTPVPNAEVTITTLGRTVRSDSAGRFRADSIPLGTHVLSVRRVGYTPALASVDVASARTAPQTIRLTKATTLSAVNVTADGVPGEFEERRQLGMGSHLTRGDLERHRGRRLGEVLSQVTGFGQAVGGATHSFVVGKRAPVRIPPREGQAGCGQGGISGTCTFTMDGLRKQGFYCPTRAEERQGILSCACFALIYVDNVLMNNSRPTEPFDVSTVAVDEIAGVEFFPTPASTPSRYSTLNAVCGVMLIWTRR